VSNTKGPATWQLATLLNDPCASFVDQPMVQLHRCETRLQQRSTTIIKPSVAPTSGKTKKAEMCLKRLANFDQSVVNHDPEFNAAPRLENYRRDQRQR
jgi:hypothetical protein